MTPDISVIICTHNPRHDYFARALRALREQTLAMENWELVVVDNCSTTAVAGRFDISWQSRARIVREDTLGLTPARLCGIREARGELLIFVDDDNLLDADYLEQALRVANEKPFLGSWSGHCRGEFDEPPPEWTRRYWGNLSIREVQVDVWSNLPLLPETMPYGAGLCVRRIAAQRYLDLHEPGRRRMQMDRAGTSLLSGGDNDLAACACDLNLGMGVVSALKLTHLIPRERLTADYLSRLADGIHYSSVILAAERGIVKSPRSRFGRCIDTLRTMRLRQPHRQIAVAAYRGRDRACSELAASQKIQPRSPVRVLDV
jgi:glycosyltransferase involved in cell wall biosynthesis